MVQLELLSETSQVSQIGCLAMMQGPRWRYWKGRLPPKTPLQNIICKLCGFVAEVEAVAGDAAGEGQVE